jgi:hypothetical protein
MNLPTKQAAAESEQLMATEFFVPALVEKLASYDIAPKNEAELGQLVKLGSMLQQAEEQGTFKIASDSTGQEANDFLAHAITKLAGTSQPDPASLDKQLLNGAIDLAKTNPLVKNAALVYAHTAAGGELAADEQPAEAE